MGSIFDEFRRTEERLRTTGGRKTLVNGNALLFTYHDRLGFLIELEDKKGPHPDTLAHSIVKRFIEQLTQRIIEGEREPDEEE